MGLRLIDRVVSSRARIQADFLVTEADWEVSLLSDSSLFGRDLLVSTFLYQHSVCLCFKVFVEVLI